MIAQSQSGTGKTAAFVLAMLSRVNPDQNFPQVKVFHILRCRQENSNVFLRVEFYQTFGLKKIPVMFDFLHINKHYTWYIRGIYSGQPAKSFPPPPLKILPCFCGLLLSLPSNSSLFFNLYKIVPPPGGGEMARIYAPD